MSYGVNISGKALSADVNVNIQVRDKSGNVKQNVYKHNKATATMTEGIVRFLRGEFNETSLRGFIPTIGDNASEALRYIPTHIGIGNVAVGSDGKIDPSYLDSDGNFKPYILPTYTDELLRNEILPKWDKHRVKIQRSTKGDSYVSDTYALTLSGFYQFYKINFDESNPDTAYSFVYASDTTQNVPYFYELLGSKKSYTITEIGLFSGDIGDTNSRLLARLVLDAQTPIILTSDDNMVINWQIGLYSLDDMINTNKQNSSDYKYQTHPTEINGIVWEDLE